MYALTVRALRLQLKDQRRIVVNSLTPSFKRSETKKLKMKMIKDQKDIRVDSDYFFQDRNKKKRFSFKKSSDITNTPCSKLFLLKTEHQGIIDENFWSSQEQNLIFEKKKFFKCFSRQVEIVNLFRQNKKQHFQNCVNESENVENAGKKPCSFAGRINVKMKHKKNHGKNTEKFSKKKETNVFKKLKNVFSESKNEYLAEKVFVINCENGREIENELNINIDWSKNNILVAKKFSKVHNKKLLSKPEKNDLSNKRIKSFDKIIKKRQDECFWDMQRYSLPYLQELSNRKEIDNNDAGTVKQNTKHLRDEKKTAYKSKKSLNQLRCKLSFQQNVLLTNKNESENKKTSLKKLDSSKTEQLISILENRTFKHFQTNESDNKNIKNVFSSTPKITIDLINEEATQIDDCCVDNVNPSSLHEAISSTSNNTTKTIKISNNCENKENKQTKKTKSNCIETSKSVQNDNESIEVRFDMESEKKFKNTDYSWLIMPQNASIYEKTRSCEILPTVSQQKALTFSFSSVPANLCDIKTSLRTPSVTTPSSVGSTRTPSLTKISQKISSSSSFFPKIIDLSNKHEELVNTKVMAKYISDEIYGEKFNHTPNNITCPKSYLGKIKIKNNNAIDVNESEMKTSLSRKNKMTEKRSSNKNTQDISSTNILNKISHSHYLQPQSLQSRQSIKIQRASFGSISNFSLSPTQSTLSLTSHLKHRLSDNFAFRSSVCSTGSSGRFGLGCPDKGRRAVQVLGILFAVFVICYLPFFALYLVKTTCISCRAYIPKNLLLGLEWLGYSGAMFNPIIYHVFNPDFRLAFKDLIRCKCHKKQKKRVLRAVSRDINSNAKCIKK